MRYLDEQEVDRRVMRAFWLGSFVGAFIGGAASAFINAIWGM